MRLLRYELKKLLCRQYLLFFFLLFLFINAFNIYSNYDAFINPDMTLSAGEYVSADNMEYALCRTYFGEITAEKVQSLKNHIEKAKSAQQRTNNAPWSDGFFRQPGGDKLAGERLLSELERLYNYDARVTEPLLKRNAELKAEENSTFSSRLCERIERIFSGRCIGEYYRVNEYRPLLSYKLSSLLLVLIGAYAASGLFAFERETKMLELQKSSPLGVKKLFFIKLAALLLFVLAASLLFFAEDLFVFTICRRPSGLNMPLWSINDIWGNYEYSPLNMSIIGFLFLLWLVRVLGVFCIAIVAMLFSVLLRRSFSAFLASLPCIGLFMALTMFTDGIFSAIRYLNPITLLIYPRLAENFIVEDITGVPLFAHELAPMGTALVLLILFAVSYSMYSRRRDDA